MRRLLIAAATLSFIASTAAVAAPCKDPKSGKFVKCRDKAAKPTRCKDTKGRFAKCGITGAKAM